jgi:uncharacterized phiE125 gp8 family phage protein
MNTYGTLTLLDSSPSGGFVEPLTVAEVRAFLSLPDRSPEDAEETATLEGFIIGAREQAEICQGRDLVRKHWQLSHDAFWRNEIALRAPLVSVESITYRDSTGASTALVAGTDYIVDTAKEPGIVLPPYGESWPSFTPYPTSAVTVQFTSGYANDAKFWSDAGQRVLIGMKLLISAWYNNRLPFETGVGPVQEYPFTVSHNLSAGGLVKVV